MIFCYQEIIIKVISKNCSNDWVKYCVAPDKMGRRIENQEIVRGIQSVDW